MSSIFSISSVTNAGIAAMQEALDHGYTMVFTAMKTGNGVYTTGEDVTGRTALKSLKNTYTIGSIEEDTDGATVSAVFTNYDGVNILVAEDYKINEIGLFCTVNSVEYLYALAAVPNDDGMEMPAYDVDAENLTQFIQEWYVANSNHANIAVNPVGAYIPVTDIVDNLTSTSTTKPLSAKQGKVLNDAKQPKTLSSPITIGGTSQTTVEGALGGLNTVKAERADITSISCTGSINATGETITNGSRFYLNGALCRATADIANGATFTLNTNFKVITVDEELTELNSKTTFYAIPESNVAIDNSYCTYSPIVTCVSLALDLSATISGRLVTVPHKTISRLDAPVVFSDGSTGSIYMPSESYGVYVNAGSWTSGKRAFINFSYVSAN